MASHQPHSIVKIAIECRNLKRGDLLSKSDPFVICTNDAKGAPGHKQELGRTEIIKNNQSPQFTQRIELQYYFEKVQKLKFKIYDSDDSGSSKDKIGKVKTTLHEIIGAKGQILVKEISSGGEIVFRAEVMPNHTFDVTLHLAASHLDKKDLFGSSDPFLVISREISNASKLVVHRTEVIEKNLNPKWQVFTLSSADLCANNFDTKLFIECFDHDKNSDPDLIGFCVASVNELKSKKTFDLINPKKAEKKGYKNSGELTAESIEISPSPSFLDYLLGGSEVSLMVAIDFTGSNGNPRDPASLHFRNPNGPNEYMMAIYGVGAVIEPYDRDKLFPVFGFGAKLPDGSISFDFNCNFTPDNPTVFGVPGIIDAYIKALNSVELYGPTNFSPILQKAITISKSHSIEEQKYYVLLILTDGEISDMEDTIDCVIKASDLPLSVIIVGVGANDFGSMRVLDGDNGKLGRKGKYVSRDIVQFVPFRAPGRTPENLAAEVLAEVPKQLVAYFRSKGVKPRQPIF